MNKIPQTISIIVMLVLISISSSIIGNKTTKLITLPNIVGVTTRTFEDKQRNNRPLITEIWYPAGNSAKGKDVSNWWIQTPQARDADVPKSPKNFPLILFSHGYADDRFTSSWFAETLAAHGYIVATIDHYGNTGHQIDELAAQSWLRPQDLSFVLTQLLNDPTFGPRIDKKRIGAAGFSLGGITALWLAGAQANFKNVESDLSTALPSGLSPAFYKSVDYKLANSSFKDNRIRAIFIMNPGFGGINSIFDKKGLAKISIPVYIIAGAGDKITPVTYNAKRFALSIPHATLRILPGYADHYVFENRCTLLGTRMRPHMCYDHPTINRKKIHRETAGIAIKFFNNNLK